MKLMIFFILISIFEIKAQRVDSTLINGDMIVFLPQEIIENRNTKLFTWTGKSINEKLNGEGILSYNGGEVFNGKIEKGYLQGDGKLIYKTGVYYQGEFDKSLRNGKGKLVYDGNGHRVEGAWKNDELEGKAIEYGILGAGDEHYRVCLLKEGIIKQIILEKKSFTLSTYRDVTIGEQEFIRRSVYWLNDTLSNCDEYHFLDKSSKGILKIGLYYLPNFYEPYLIVVYKSCDFGKTYNSNKALLTIETQFDNLGDRIVNYQITGYKNLCFLKKHKELLQILNSRGDVLKTLTIEEIKASRKKR